MPLLDLLDYEPAGLFGGEPARNAFVELHNLVVAGADPTQEDAPIDFGPEDADRIARERGVDFAVDFRDERLALYEALFDRALATGTFDANACRLLGVAAETLALTPADVRPLHERTFGDAVSVVLADDCLDVGERMHLYALQQGLGLDPAAAAADYDRQARARLLEAVARALCDGELSPDEAAEVAAAAGALGLSVGAPITAMLSDAAERWAVRTAPMPTVHAGIRLDPDETAHAEVPARWGNKRWDALRQAFEGGLSNSETRYQPFPWHRVTSPLRSGRIVLTNRRLVLLDSEHPTRSVRLSSIREAVAFADGALVRLDGDARRLLIELGPEADAFVRLLTRALDAAPDRLKQAPAAVARWREVAKGERPVTDRAAQRFCEQLAADPFGWDVPGTVSTAGAHLVLENVVGTHTVRTGHIDDVSLSGRALCIRQSSGTGWVVLFDQRDRAREAFTWLQGRLNPKRLG